MKRKYLKFWGTRGSCAVSGPEYEHFGGNTACAELQYGSTRLIFDAGTGIRPLGVILSKERLRKIDLFLSHTHWDHLIGFPFFAPLRQKNSHVTIWAPKGSGRSCRELFQELLSPEFFPVSLQSLEAKLQFRTIAANRPVKIGKHLSINFHPTHHTAPTLCFKIQTPLQTIGYVTDNEIQDKAPDSLIRFFKGCDLFIHEAQYFPEEYATRGGWGHSSTSHVLDLVQEIAPKKWYVTHHDPFHSDAILRQSERLLKRKSRVPVEFLADGQEVELL